LWLTPLAQTANNGAEDTKISHWLVQILLAQKGDKHNYMQIALAKAQLF
jgi:hypothetical protein